MNNDKDFCVIDNNGSFIAYVRIDTFAIDGEEKQVIAGYEIQSSEILVDLPYPFGFIKAKANSTRTGWIEFATLEEIAVWESKHPSPPPMPPTPLEMLVQENKLLKAQITAESDRADFIEDCIAEMATQVYIG